MKLRSNKFLKLAILAVTLVAFIIYATRNWQDFTQIKDISLLHIGLIVCGQLIVIGSNIIILKVIVGLDKKQMSWPDAGRVTTYSSLINFFGFLQAGLGFRGGYLKKYLGMTLRKYGVLTLVQYLCIFGISALLLLVGYFLIQGPHILLLAIAVVVMIATVLVVAKRLSYPPLLRWEKRLIDLSEIGQPKLIIFMILAAMLQLAGSALVFGTELNAIGASITFGGFLIYVSLAQFSIIFAVTPGAIGIREALLLVAQTHMMLSTQDIVLASTIDRIIYCLVLVLITPFALGIKSRSRTQPVGN